MRTKLRIVVWLAALAACQQRDRGSAEVVKAIAEPPTALRLVGQSVIPVDKCSPVHLDAVRYGPDGAVQERPLTVVPVALTLTGGASLYTDPDCSAPLDGSSWLGATSLPLYLWSGEATSGVITATTPSLDTAELPYAFAVVGLPWTARASGPRLVAAGACTRYVFGLHDPDGLPTITHVDRRVELDGVYLSYYASGDCSIPFPARVATVRAGTGSVAVWMRAGAPFEGLALQAVVPDRGRFLGPALLVNARVATRIALDGPATIGPGQCAAYRVHSLDDVGRDAPVAADTEVTLRGARHGLFFADPACQVAIPFLTTLVGNRHSRTVYFADPTAEELTLSAASSVGAPATRDVVVVAPTHLVLTGDTTVVAGATCGELTLTLRAQLPGGSVAVGAPTLTQVHLGSTPDLTLFAGRGCDPSDAGVTSTFIPAGSPSMALSYRGNSLPPGAGFRQGQIAVADEAAPGLGDVLLPVTIVSDTAPAALRLAPVPQPRWGYVGECMPFDLQTVDAAGRPAALGVTSMGVQIGAAGASVVYTDAGCMRFAPARTLTLLQGESTKRFWLRDLRVEALNLTATGTMSSADAALTLATTRPVAIRGELEVLQLLPARDYLCSSATLLVHAPDGAIVHAHADLPVTFIDGGTHWGTDVEAYASDDCTGPPLGATTIPANQGGITFSFRAHTDRGAEPALRVESASSLVDPAGAIIGTIALDSVTFTPDELYLEPGAWGTFAVTGIWGGAAAAVEPRDRRLLPGPNGGFLTPELDGFRASPDAAGVAVYVSGFIGGGSIATVDNVTTIVIGAPVSASVLPVAPAASVGASTRLTLDARWRRYASDGTLIPYPCSRCPAAWSSDRPDLVAVDPETGVATALAPGVATITGSFKGVSATATFTVTAPVALTVTPAAQTIPKGATRAFVARNEVGADVSAAVAWTSSDPAVATVAGGVVTGVNVGAAVITASGGALTLRRPVTVGPPAVAALTITPFDTLLVGGGAALAVTATYTDGSSADVSDQVDWSSSVPSTAHVSSASRRAIGRTRGVATLTASLGGVSASTSIQVYGLAVSAATAAPLPIGGTRAMTATLTDSSGVSWDVTSQVSWSVESSTTQAGYVVGTVSTGGVVTGVATGALLVRAVLPGYAGSAGFGVIVGNTPPQFLGLALTYDDLGPIGQPGDPRQTLGRGELVKLRARLSILVGALVFSIDAPGLPWTSTSPTTLAALGEGWFAGLTAQAAGAPKVTVQAMFPIPPFPVGSAALGVTTPAPTRIDVAPAFARLPQGTSIAETATVRFADGTSADVTSSAAWSSSSAAVAVDSSDATGVSAGSAQITASHLGVQGSARLDVSAGGLGPYSVVPDGATVVGQTPIQLTALGETWDGTTAELLDLTAQARWAVVDRQVATVSDVPGQRGVARGASSTASGETFVYAELRGPGGTSYAVLFKVVPASLVSLSVEPAAVRVLPGSATTLVATGDWSDGTTSDVTASASWISSAPAVVDVTGPGAVKCLVQGSATVTASQAGQSDAAAVTCAVGEP